MKYVLCRLVDIITSLDDKNLREREILPFIFQLLTAVSEFQGFWAGRQGLISALCRHPFQLYVIKIKYKLKVGM